MMVDDDRGTIQHIRDFAGNSYDIANISFEHVPKNREEPKLLEADDGRSDASKCLKARLSGKSSKFG